MASGAVASGSRGGQHNARRFGASIFSILDCAPIHTEIQKQVFMQTTYVRILEHTI